MKPLALAAILVAAAGAARADEVVLRNGARFEGQVKESGDTVTVVMDFGSMTFKKIDVARVVRSTSALAEFDAKILDLKVDDLEGRYKLGLWARQKELNQRAQKTFEEILVRDPEHAGAREALGYRKHEGRWLSEDQIKIEKGLELFRGEWVRRDLADDIRRIEAERAAESSRIAELERMQVRVAEAEAAANRAKEEAARARANDDYFPRYITVWRPFPRFDCRPKRFTILPHPYPIKPPGCVEKKVK